MKGKKFNAAEKHFREKEILYQQQINSLSDQLLSREEAEILDYVKKILAKEIAELILNNVSNNGRQS